MTPEERGDLAERMVYKAARLSVITHGEGGTWDVSNLIGHLTQTELHALVIVLAGMVDPDLTVQQALGHVDWDEDGYPVRHLALPACTIRELATHRLVAAS